MIGEGEKKGTGAWLWRLESRQIFPRLGCLLKTQQILPTRTPPSVSGGARFLSLFRYVSVFGSCCFPSEEGSLSFSCVHGPWTPVASGRGQQGVKAVPGVPPPYVHTSDLRIPIYTPPSPMVVPHQLSSSPPSFRDP